METLIQQLQELGLDDKEIEVYLSCLEVGESHIMPIVEKAKLPRTTVFHILDRLEKRGLIEAVLKGSRHIYTPYPPKHLLSVLNSEKEDIESRINSIDKVLPELAGLFKMSALQPKVRIFQGIELRKIYEEILEEPIDEVLYVGNVQRFETVVGSQWLKNWIEKRVAKNIKSKAIRIKTGEIDIPTYVKEKDYKRAIRFAPDGFECPTHIIIYGDNIGFMTTGQEHFGLVVTSREIAESMVNWFNQLWKISK